MAGDACDMQRICNDLFDPVVSSLLEQLADGPKSIAQLCESSGLGAGDVRARLAYLAEHGFVSVDGETYSADGKKIDAALATTDRFDGAIDKVTEMDSYLN